jgi:hypothetical protein
MTAVTTMTTADRCLSCGAAMAHDQRYCLTCGDRRAEARLDWAEVLRRDPLPPGAIAHAGSPVAADAARQRVNTTVVASVGCLLLAMGVGVLIGNSGNGGNAAPAAAPAAQVIKVQGGGTATAAGSSATTGKKAAKKASTRKGSSSKVPTAASAAASKATNPTLTQLSNTSGKNYQKQSQKLPKVVSTGGKAPPIDKTKPAGGGSAVQTIG